MSTDWWRDWHIRSIEMQDHADMVVAHMKSILSRFTTEEDLFEETAAIFDPVMEWLEKEAPWL